MAEVVGGVEVAMTVAALVNYSTVLAVLALLRPLMDFKLFWPRKILLAALDAVNWFHQILVLQGTRRFGRSNVRFEGGVR